MLKMTNEEKEKLEFEKFKKEIEKELIINRLNIALAKEDKED